jgi:hypothetical protein
MKGYYASTRHLGRHVEVQHPGLIEVIEVVETPGEIEYIGMAVLACRADDGQPLYVIHLRDYDGALPGYWILVDGEFQPAQ